MKFSVVSGNYWVQISANCARKTNLNDLRADCDWVSWKPFGHVPTISPVDSTAALPRYRIKHSVRNVVMKKLLLITSLSICINWFCCVLCSHWNARVMDIIPYIAESCKAKHSKNLRKNYTNWNKVVCLEEMYNNNVEKIV